MTDPLHGDGARTGASAPKDADPSVGELFGRLTEHTTRLVRAEIALAKAELKAKLTRLRDESIDHQKWFEDPESCPMGGRGRGGAGPSPGRGRGGPGAGRGPAGGVGPGGGRGGPAVGG